MGAIEPRMHTLADGTEVLLRGARADDAPRLAELIAAIIAEDRYTLASPGEAGPSAEGLRQRIAEYLDQPGYLYLVAEAAGQVIGHLDFSNGRLRKTAHAGAFAVYLAEGWRGRGVGPLLIERLLAWARAHPLIEKVTLAVFSNNPRAIAAYQKCGFYEEGRCPRDMKLDSGEYIDSVLMYQFVK